MTRSTGFSILLATLTLILGSCGSTSKTLTRTTSRTTPAATTPSGELLSVPAVGRIYGRCKRGDPRWTIRFEASQIATDRITYRVGSGRSRTVSTEPHLQALTWMLTPGRFPTREPADPAIQFPATTIKTTEPISLDITQGTEPHFYRVKIRFAVASALGDTNDCALVSSSVTATTYYTGGQPPS
jgi:hypothetical protein